MPSIDSIVNISISRQTQAASLPGFGTPLILGQAGNWPAGNVGKINKYGSLAAVSGDFATNTVEYLMASAIFSQTPKPQFIKIAKRTATVAQVNTITPTAADNTAFVVTIDGVPYSFTSGVSATATTIVTGLKALIAADPNCRMVASGISTLILTSSTPGYGSSVSVSSNMASVQTTANNGAVEDLMAAQQQDNDWYCLLNSSRTNNDVLAVAAWMETQKKIQIITTNDANAPASVTTDIASLLKAKNYFRSSAMYSSTAAEHPASAWAGRVLPLDPGSETWKFKSLAAITPENLTDTQVGNLDGKNCNYEITIAGINMTAQGKVAGGDFIDVIRGIDWLQSIMQAEIFTTLTQSNKVPYTDAGIAVIESCLRKCLQRAVRVGLIASNQDWTVTVPAVSSVSSSDKSTRTLNGVTFNAVLAGAIHLANISGVVTV